MRRIRRSACRARAASQQAAKLSFSCPGRLQARLNTATPSRSACPAVFELFAPLHLLQQELRVMHRDFQRHFMATDGQQVARARVHS
jgi:hypothetical protein